MTRVWATAWARAGLTLLQSGDGHVEGGFFGVEVLLGDELFLVEGLGAVVVELLLFEVGLAPGRCWP